MGTPDCGSRDVWGGPGSQPKGSPAVEEWNAGRGDFIAARQEAVVGTSANGTFEVKLSPLALNDAGAGASLARMSIEKRFQGDLEGSSAGEMLSSGTAGKGSAGYVAMERVSGTLHGRRGTFVLQHSGTMNRGSAQLSVTVVPDSGTEELSGLSGTMTIDIVAGKHSYAFDYRLEP